ncbi:dicarboxylate/amino acid:cation symporter [Lacticaseibacillus baoqingensis]|uniref:Dicarboxylate/amino acid:cation symporter n=1 Tax=Lacticaseibacillus baoqingensis TaxID=2486013 RepID=A0ABW4EBR5_9LACO|nr:dicarboxylate/amino acid:cation symporter [Lacticaseibacillus baoqingensis]
MKAMITKMRGWSLFTKIMIGFALGIIAGLVMGKQATMFTVLGDILVNLLQVVVAPLVFSLMVVAIADIDDMKQFGKIAMKTVGTYAVYTLIAVTLGLSFGLLFHVGQGANINVANVHVSKPASVTISDTILSFIPSNIVKSISEGNLVQVIFFAVIFGFSILAIGDKGKPMLDVCKSLAETMKHFVNVVLGFTPIGVFGLMASVIGKSGIAIIWPYLKAIAAVYAASGIQTIVLHGLIVCWLICKIPLGRYLKASREPMVFAFSTTSSVATIPLSLRAVKRLGVSDRIGNFIITIGSNMSMDGIAIYEGVAIVFASQIYGVHFTVIQLLRIMLIAAVTSLGLAGVPGSGLIAVSVVLQTAGLPLSTVGLLAGVDRLLNMGRIIPNVTADISTSVLVAKSEHELDLHPVDPDVDPVES